MGVFEKVISLPHLQNFFSLEDDAFIEETGWQSVLQKVVQLKDQKVLLKIIEEAKAEGEKQKIILGYLYTMLTQGADGPVELPCVDYAGCYLSRGALKLKSRPQASFCNYVGLGMNASTPDSRISVEGNVGDYLGYRASKANIEVKGSAREKAGIAIGDGTLRVEGDVTGSLGGSTQSTLLEVHGTVGSIERDNVGCTILVGGDVNWGIGENQQDCFIRVCGNVGFKTKKTDKQLDIATGLKKNSMLLVGEDIYGNIGKGMEVAKIFIWGRVHGEIDVSDSEGGFVYLNKWKTPILQRIKTSIGGKIGIKYVKLKRSGYLFAESPDDVQELVVG